MEVNILVISNENPSMDLIEYFKDKGYHLEFSRGPLKTGQMLAENQVDSIIWIFSFTDLLLAEDLINKFNLYPKIPIIVISEKNISKKYSDNLKGFYQQIDYYENYADLCKLVQKACNHYRLEQKENPIPQRDIEFKKIVHQIVTNKNKGEKAKESSVLELATPWNIVDNKEKDILAAVPDKKRSKFRKWLDKF